MDLPEDYMSPFDFEQGVNTNYLYLCPTAGLTPPGSPEASVRGVLHLDSAPELADDAMSFVATATRVLTQDEQEELRYELAKVEDEIQTLSQVLALKEKRVTEIKRKLGVMPLNEFKQNVTRGWHEVTTSAVYKKTSETLSQAEQKATAAFSTVGFAISRSIEDMRNRLVIPRGPGPHNQL